MRTILELQEVLLRRVDLDIDGVSVLYTCGHLLYPFFLFLLLYFWWFFDVIGNGWGRLVSM